MTPEQTAHTIEKTVRAVMEDVMRPAILEHTRVIVESKMSKFIDWHLQRWFNRPWRWLFHIGKYEVAIRRKQ